MKIVHLLIIQGNARNEKVPGKKFSTPSTFLLPLSLSKNFFDLLNYPNADFSRNAERWKLRVYTQQSNGRIWKFYVNFSNSSPQSSRNCSRFLAAPLALPPHYSL